MKDTRSYRMARARARRKAVVRQRPLRESDQQLLRLAHRVGADPNLFVVGWCENGVKALEEG
jgi:hypothetical protein